MSAMICSQCNIIVHTDRDPDALYCEGFDCVCRACRDRLDLAPNYDLPSRTAGPADLTEDDFDDLGNLTSEAKARLDVLDPRAKE